MTAGSLSPSHSDDGPETAIEMTRQEQMANDEVPPDGGKPQVSRHDRHVVVHSRDPPAQAVVAELEVGKVDIDNAFEQGHGLGRGEEVGLPDDRQ